MQLTSDRWVPVAAIISVNAFQTIGFVSVVQLLLAESFPTEIRSAIGASYWTSFCCEKSVQKHILDLILNCHYRSYASGICGAFTAVNMFGATKLYPWFVHVLGFHGTFWLYSLVMLLEVVYAAISIPENRGESLVATEEKMARRG